MKVIIYTKNKCAECEKLKAVLGYMPIEADIEQRNIEEDSKWFDELAEMGYQSVPITVVPEKNLTIVGFEVGELQDAFGL